MNDYERAVLPAVEAALFKGKVIVIYGARQVGNTPKHHSLFLAHL